MVAVPGWHRWDDHTMDDDDQYYPRMERTEPPTKHEFALLTRLLTLPELTAAIGEMSDEHQALLGRQLMSAEQLH
jgi:hypothetical protein